MKEKIENELRKLIEERTSRAAAEDWEKAVGAENKPIYNYRRNHIAHVEKLAGLLANSAEANVDVVILAAWLHDIAKPGINGTKKHGIKSARLARNILSKMDIDKSTINRVCEAIEKHIGLTLTEQLEPLEAQILWEADKLSKIGAIGTIHHIINGIMLNPGMTPADISENLSEFMSLAEEIAGSMATQKAKQIASERLGTMRAFIEDFEEEMSRDED